MLKANRKTLIITSIVTILPVLIGVIYWNRLPDVMATHFGTNNEANGFSSKAFAVFGIPAFLLAVLWLGAFVTARDPRKQNISPKMFTLVLWIVPVISLIVAAIQYPVNLGYQMNITFYMELVLGMLFVIIGNYLPKARQNYTIGIKIPWTLANEENWNRTHRLAGYLWMICGILIIIACLTRIIPAEWLIGIILIMVLVPCIYSYWLHVKKGL
ncbi:MAG: SdpI family protein [Erysipelotrichaceae bacterium]|nr:SdpI family protein [Erysipelotrichaceae bacterium]